MKKILALALALLMLGTLTLPAGAATHGTTNQTITADMVDNTPPADYAINTATQAKAMEGKYNAFFLKDSLQTVEITLPENNLNYLLQNAMEETYVMTETVTIGGTTLGYCGLRTKGNFTLEHAFLDNPGSDRFSFTVNFGKYITQESYGDRQTFYGCKKISFNNFFFDKSMLKEYCAFLLMEEMGLPTPQFGLAKLYINGQYYGVYFMVEALDDTILQQQWQVSGKELSSYLVKPTGTNFDYNELAKDANPLYEHDEETFAQVRDMLPTVLDWSKKLTNLSQGKDFEGNALDIQSQAYLDLLGQILDLDEVVKYFAVSSWLCQLDNMFTNYQNFGLYVSAEGRATLLPWDYDLAFGCYYPSTAQTTANYPVDVMYRLEPNLWAGEAAMSAQTYRTFPLFQVIYQNDALMEQYHSYMAECSQVAALGGTVASTGKSYPPAYLNRCMETLTEALTAAATEKTADNVYYMNHINQPRDMKKALPNISAIVALRALGVWSQVKGLDATVSAGGCDLETLGNASPGDCATTGRLITVHAGTGIFALAEYEGLRRGAIPALKVSLPEPGSSGMTKITDQLTLGSRDTVTVWALSAGAKAKSGYTVTIPLGPEYLTGDTTLHFYILSGGKLVPLTPTREGNLFTFESQNLGTVVVHAQRPGTLLDFVGDNAGILAVIIAVAGAGTLVTVLLIRKKRAK